MRRILTIALIGLIPLALLWPLPQLGSVVRHKNGWRVQVGFGKAVETGPTRSSEAEAQADLDRARRSASRDTYKPNAFDGLLPFCEKSMQTMNEQHVIHGVR